MSFEARAAAMQSRGIRHFGGGGTASVRRRHTLQAIGKPVASLTTSGAHSIDATTLVLKGPAGAALYGELPAGVTFMVAGDGQVYTSTAVAAVATNNPGAISVPISPALLSAPASGSAVVLLQPYGAQTLSRMRGAELEQDMEGGVRGVRRVVNLAADGALFTPRTGDLVVADGETRAVVSVEVVKSGSIEQRYRVTLGDLG